MSRSSRLGNAWVEREFTPNLGLRWGWCFWSWRGRAWVKAKARLPARLGRWRSQLVEDETKMTTPVGLGRWGVLRPTLATMGLWRRWRTRLVQNRGGCGRRGGFWLGGGGGRGCGLRFGRRMQRGT